MWEPILPPGSLPLYERLVLAMAEDIRAGRLGAGTRLPPQRDLAFRLGISVGSVTRAYEQAERRGLVVAHVGRGTFVRGAVAMGVDSVPRDASAAIDLRHNVPPVVPLLAELNGALHGLLKQGAAGAALQYAPAMGLLQVRRAAVDWLASAHGLAVEAENLVQCNGAQHAIALVFSSICAPGETILCESSSFYGARLAAEHLGLRLLGVPMDDEGMIPDELERAALQSGSRLVFTLPTLHNPTTRTMSESRRQQIAAIARARDLLILEDEAYYAYAERPRQIVTYAPERTIYLAGFSKGYCPGLRLAFLALPPDLPRERLLRGIRAFGYCPPALGALVFTDWVVQGRIEAIGRAIQDEAAARWAIAQAIVGQWIAPAGAERSPHAWLPLSGMEAERMSARLLRAGVDVMPPDTSLIARDADTGLRLCLGAPATRDQLETALTIVAKTLQGQGNADRDGLI